MMVVNDRRPPREGHRAAGIVGLVLLAVTSVCPASQAPDDPGGQPALNVILITISSLRADHVSCFGYGRDTTPHFDRFAAEHVCFRNAFATSGWMMPAHGSLFTSLYPSCHGATHIDRTLGAECTTLAEILADNGYYCAGFCCGPRLDAEHGFARGFHVYDDQSVVGLLQAMAFDQPASVDLNRQRTNDLINDAATGWLRSNTHHPFFLFVHYYDNHWDYLPPEPYRSLYDPNYTGLLSGTRIAREPLYSNPPGERDVEHLMALYDGEVRQTDEDLGELLATLQDRGLFENSMIVILGDHGEEFYEHGHTSHHGVYDELIHIPLAISVPCVGRRTTDALVSQVDLLPTVLDGVGIPVPEWCQGRSLMGVVEGRVQSANAFVVAEYTGRAVEDIFAVRSRRTKCCVTGAGDVFAYDLIADPGELAAIAAKDFNRDMQVLEKELLKLMSPYLRQQEPANTNHDSEGD